MDAHAADPWLNFWPLCSEFTVERNKLEICCPRREIKLTHSRSAALWFQNLVESIVAVATYKWMGFKKHSCECLRPCYQDGGRSWHLTRTKQLRTWAVERKVFARKITAFTSAVEVNLTKKAIACSSHQIGLVANFPGQWTMLSDQPPVSSGGYRNFSIWSSNVYTVKDQITARASADQSLPLVICRTLDISSPIGPGKGEQGNFHHGTARTPWATPTTVPAVSPACGRSLLKGGRQVFAARTPSAGAPRLRAAQAYPAPRLIHPALGLSARSTSTADDAGFRSHCASTRYEEVGYWKRAYAPRSAAAHTGRGLIRETRYASRLEGYADLWRIHIVAAGCVSGASALVRPDIFPCHDGSEAVSRGALRTPRSTAVPTGHWEFVPVLVRILSFDLRHRNSPSHAWRKNGGVPLHLVRRDMVPRRKAWASTTLPALVAPPTRSGAPPRRTAHTPAPPAPSIHLPGKAHLASITRHSTSGLYSDQNSNSIPSTHWTSVKSPVLSVYSSCSVAEKNSGRRSSVVSPHLRPPRHRPPSQGVGISHALPALMAPPTRSGAPLRRTTPISPSRPFDAPPREGTSRQHHPALHAKPGRKRQPAWISATLSAIIAPIHSGAPLRVYHPTHPPLPLHTRAPPREGTSRQHHPAPHATPPARRRKRIEKERQTHHRSASAPSWDRAAAGFEVREQHEGAPELGAALSTTGSLRIALRTPDDASAPSEHRCPRAMPLYAEQPTAPHSLSARPPKKGRERVTERATHHEWQGITVFLSSSGGSGGDSRPGKTTGDEWCLRSDVISERGKDKEEQGPRTKDEGGTKSSVSARDSTVHVHLVPSPAHVPTTAMTSTYLLRQAERCASTTGQSERGGQGTMDVLVLPDSRLLGDECDIESLSPDTCGDG
ncbi:hypothetical protein B0H13DRAFT_1888498 [Mycena leptocephala]|nr:hypothetical protein B0H13DRAFT_1888498 [Mycena leptocephala]